MLICDPTATIPSRHVLATAAAQNYGLSTYRIRQPFDFAGRTGTIKLDMDLTNNGLGGWPALILAQDPSPAPSFDWQERGSGPRNGIEIEFGTGWCNTPQTMEVIVYTFADYLQTASVPSFDCGIPHATTAPGALNHVEVYVTQTHVEVWTSDTSPDGLTFPNQQLLWAGDVALPFSRGYVSLAVRNHATIKYWLGSAAEVRWDNVGFDGPVVTGWHDVSAPDSLSAYRGCRAAPCRAPPASGRETSSPSTRTTAGAWNAPTPPATTTAKGATSATSCRTSTRTSPPSPCLSPACRSTARPARGWCWRRSTRGSHGTA